MSDLPEDTFDGLGLSLPGGTPDEDAWESYLISALEALGADGERSLSNAQLGALESVLGCQVPFEIGMLLIMGVPDNENWLDWRVDPAATMSKWGAWVLEGICFDVEHEDFWSTALGPRPDTMPARLAQVAEVYPTLPRLLPLWGHRAIPLAVAADERTNDFNPVFSVMRTSVIQFGVDLAAALHADFAVPLPPWPEPAPRRFPFWSDLSDED